MSQITLYVDGACRGNPGLGGWGAYIITENAEHKLCGGEAESTNNRMELTAAIEGIAFCPIDAKLIIWTDSIYVKRGITEWIEGWKKKNWKDVKNPDLWQKLDATCKGREIEWNWIKGHSGHPGNEMADQLANLGADQTLEKIKKGQLKPQLAALDSTAPTLQSDDKKKDEKDWLLDDPFGFDFSEEDQLNAEEYKLNSAMPDHTKFDHSVSDQSTSDDTMLANKIPEHTPDSSKLEDALDTTTINSLNSSDLEASLTESAHLTANTFDSKPVEADSALSEPSSLTTELQHPHVVITAAKVKLQGPRQLILDTETTGFYYQDSDRIVEVGAIEMINRKLTGSSIHVYINPKKPVGDSENIHGISDEFLKDKPVYAEVADVLFEYLKGAEIIAHNASFDMNFLNMEFKRAGYVALSDVCEVTDTLALAKSKHPGQKNSLDALVRRYDIAQRDRTFHGALLDAEILADVYLAMTGGQVSFDMDSSSSNQENSDGRIQRAKIEFDLPVIFPSEKELEEHENWVKQYQEKHGEDCFFAK